MLFKAGYRVNSAKEGKIKTSAFLQFKSVCCCDEDVVGRQGVNDLWHV